MWCVQEIYGLEPVPAQEATSTTEGEVGGERGAGPSEEASSSGVEMGKDCVICLCSPRDTAALPCRHMVWCPISPPFLLKLTCQFL